MKRFFVLFFLLSIAFGGLQAQSIKQQAERQKQQQAYERERQAQDKARKEALEREKRERELKEKNRIAKAMLSLNDMESFLVSDLDSVDRNLSDRGWELNSSNVDDDNSKVVVWAFDKNLYFESLAKAWLYYNISQTNGDILIYSIADESQVNKLKSELVNSKYDRYYPTDAIERGLESVFRNEKYEVSFKKRLKDTYEDGADIRYDISIYDYVLIEEKKAEAERIKREAAKRESNYQNAIKEAESFYKRNQYAEAKQSYNEAIEIKPENKQFLQEKIAEIDIAELCEDADNFYYTKQYAKAKAKYNEALKITPNQKTDYIKGKIAEINEMQSFLQDRTQKYYDYSTIESSDYDGIEDYQKGELKKILAATTENFPNTNVYITYKIDTLNNVTVDYTTSVINSKLNVILDSVIKYVTLKPCYIKGYPVMAKAEFSYSVGHQYSTITVKKTPDGITSKDQNFRELRSETNNIIGRDAPYGRYTLQFNKTSIDGLSLGDNKLLKAKKIGGASNAWLSILIPGLGKHKVTFGEKKGVGTALFTYALIGGGVGLKLYSNKEYKKYHLATEQNDIDSHYRKANYSNQAFYGCLVVGGIIWISDIIWVAAVGAKNGKALREYRKSHLTAYYNYDYNATGLSYTYNF